MPSSATSCPIASTSGEMRAPIVQSITFHVNKDTPNAKEKLLRTN